jgi:hypothetical protein
MSRIAVRIGGGTAAAATTAITIALILILMMASPAVILTTTTEAFAAASKSNNNNKDCKDIPLYTFEQDSYARQRSGNTITIGTPQPEYSVKIDYIRISNTDDYSYYKNLEANDPRGRALLPAGKTISITLQTDEEPLEGHGGTYVTLYNDKVSDCDIIGFGHIEAQDMVNLKIIGYEQDSGSKIVKLTVQVPDATGIDKHFTKLGVQFPINPEVKEFYLISHKVHVR